MGICVKQSNYSYYSNDNIINMFSFILKLHKTTLFLGLILFYSTSLSLLSQENIYIFFQIIVKGRTSIFAVKSK